MTCKLCNNTTRTITHPKRGVFHLCPHCGLIAKDELFHPSEEEAFQEYSLHENSLEDPLYQAYFRRFLESAVLPFVKEGRLALDYGSGPTPVLATLLGDGYGFQVETYDLFFSPEKVYENKKYDLITSTEVLEHLDDPLSAFQLFASLLAPGGILAVMTLLHHHDEAQFLKWHYIQEVSHISFFALETLQFLSEEVGLELLYSDEKRYATFKGRA
ncbi:class I SAM-dependent methyltransferase [Sphaerochaeta sp. PS]|uniref:class I SAM-dependent methyltransferase n=1 Tax=Sphaerochaeta sp. PS TaxID=3076336 RepID=UPI0028A2DE84|nr:class I SAM-dependent methyltransferase [Sphaerochaeta sp. PS]MDT4763159.1 class I SAM-dependent methyltransferase [Sphaerochaeta sp. PS]